MKGICVVLLLFCLAGSAQSGDYFSGMKGIEKTDSVFVYDTATLWEYINGAADLFIDYGFQELQSVDVKLDSIGATVDVYDMGSPLNAFGIYALERPRDADRLAIGTEAVIQPPAQCLLLKDRYYIKFNFFEGKLNAQNGRALLQRVAAALPGEAAYPKHFSWLPGEKQIINSFSFVAESFQGLDELRNCVSAKYGDSGNADYQYFIALPGRDESVSTVWERFFKLWTISEQNGHQVLFKEIPYKGLVGVVLINDKIYGVTDCPDEDVLLQRMAFLLDSIKE